jgi:hypothetical protein
MRRFDYSGKQTAAFDGNLLPAELTPCCVSVLPETRSCGAQSRCGRWTVEAATWARMSALGPKPEILKVSKNFPGLLGQRTLPPITDAPHGSMLRPVRIQSRQGETCRVHAKFGQIADDLVPKLLGRQVRQREL